MPDDPNLQPRASRREREISQILRYFGTNQGAEKVRAFIALLVLSLWLCEANDLVHRVSHEPVTVHRREIEIMRVIDGDTYSVRPVEEMIVRLSNADTWESRKVRRKGDKTVITTTEIDKGKKAREAVLDLIKLKRVWLETGKDHRDSFGRELGRIYVIEESGMEIDLGEWLTKNGHTRITL